MYLKVKTSEEVMEILRGFGPTAGEDVSLENGPGRVLSGEIISPEDLPGFNRSSMDGYAVMAKDTFGATEALPALLEVGGEVIMGRPPDVKSVPGKAIKISTGGMLPEGADGVVMLEYCHTLDPETIEVTRAISPLENVICKDDDFKAGVLVFHKGHVLRPQDIGLLAGLGISRLPVHARPKVAVISTGDEVIPVGQRPAPGQVRDINSYTLNAFCLEAGAIPILMGLCGDRFELLRERIRKGMEEADSLWISGGSSVGTRDITLKVLESFDDTEVLVHGISISPGKPTIIARIGRKAVFGLPGHTASAMVIAEVFLRPFLAHLSGERDIPWNRDSYLTAELSRNIESASGRDDYIRVKLTSQNHKLIAEPIFGKSGLISTLVEAQGLIRVDRNSEGLYKGQPVKVILFDPHKGAFP